MVRTHALPNLLRPAAVVAVLAAGNLLAAGADAAHASPSDTTYPAKLEVLRAGVEDGRLDVLADITNRANGDRVRGAFIANGTRVRFTAPIEDGRIRFKRRLPDSQRAMSTGIMEIQYAGNQRVRPTEVRLRAANGKARLGRDLLSIEDGVVTARGTVTGRADGVVRLNLSYENRDSSVGEWQGRAPIDDDGSWHVQEDLPVEARGGGYLSIQFTGHYDRRVRGEQIAKEVLDGQRFEREATAVTSARRPTKGPKPNDAPAPSEPAPAPAPTDPAPAPSEPAPAPTDPAPAPAPTFTRLGSFELGDFSEFYWWGQRLGTLEATTERAYDGSWSAKATHSGESGISYQRVGQDVGWEPGSDVWYGAALYIPETTNWCWYNPIRWDNYATYQGQGDVGGLQVENGRLYVMRAYFGGEEHHVVGPMDLPRGRWVWVELHQRLSSTDGDALTEVFIDGARAGASTLANMAGRRVDHVNFGTVAIATSCSDKGSIYVDRVSVSDGPIGPL